MSSTGISTPKRKVLSLKVKRAILEEVRRNVKKSEIARKYEIAPSTLSTIIKNGDKIDAALNDDAGSVNWKKLRKPLYSDVEEALYNGAWRDVKPETISHCFKSGGFSRTRVLEAPAASDEVVADAGVPAVNEICAPLEKMWESLAQVQLVPSGVNLVEFVTTEDDIVATEEMTDEDLANCCLVEDVRANESDSDSDDDCRVKPVGVHRNGDRGG
ncbi:hypothetical protein HPB47_018876 [Ixodes persulcatus]|uniref:Uncharacterized protein n=1 Tax=Ixodes persulcatus TaxID=34615 RepID=A0AC60QN71_IXOPE|nr:hypothetical protein HPB47_018876 [Ixodes persulcatus]